MSISIARLLAFLYTNKKCRVKWRGEVSENVGAQNGVKQGGVLSPLLFNIYLDVLFVVKKEWAGLSCG